MNFVEERVGKKGCENMDEDQYCTFYQAFAMLSLNLLSSKDVHDRD